MADYAAGNAPNTAALGLVLSGMNNDTEPNGINTALMLKSMLKKISINGVPIFSFPQKSLLLQIRTLELELRNLTLLIS